MGRFFDSFKPIARFLPEVSKPTGRVSFTEKLFWTGIVLIIYLVMRLVPLWGWDRRDNKTHSFQSASSWVDTEEGSLSSG